MRRGAFVVISAVLGVAGHAFAHSIECVAYLSGTAQSPPNSSLGTGTVLAILNADLATLNIQATFSGLSGTTTTAHIRGLTTTPFTGTANAVTTLPTLPNFPSGVTSVSYYNQTLDLANSNSYNPGFIATSGGTVGQAFNRLIFGMVQGRTYFNINSNAFPSGEIRGFLGPFPDANHDGKINSLDFSAMAASYNTFGTLFESGDFNIDGYTNSLDFNAIATHFGESVNFPMLQMAALVPEPVTLSPIVALPFLARRCKRWKIVDRSS